MTNYNSNDNRFDGRCFLEDVEIKLQKRLEEIGQSLSDGQKEIDNMQEYYWENYAEMDQYGYEDYDNQQALLHQEFVGHLLDAAAVHVHRVGELHHVLAADLAGEQLQHLLQVGSRVVEVLKEVVSHQEGPVILGEEALVVLQDGEVCTLVQSVGGIDHHGVKGPVLHGVILEHYVHGGGRLEV